MTQSHTHTLSLSLSSLSLSLSSLSLSLFLSFSLSLFLALFSFSYTHTHTDGDAGKERAREAVPATRKNGNERAAKSEMYMQSLSQIDAEDMAALPPEIQAELRLLPNHRPGRSRRPPHLLPRAHKGGVKPGSGQACTAGRGQACTAVRTHAPATGRQLQRQGEISGAQRARGEGPRAQGLDSAVVLELENQMGVSCLLSSAMIPDWICHDPCFRKSSQGSSVS